ncbi:hypothetical protein FJZ36_07725 [Candidatus Poribacteria bacterium]|nr:hypothetical protein [Candidatus Poribacteria bacterium]
MTGVIATLLLAIDAFLLLLALGVGLWRVRRGMRQRERRLVVQGWFTILSSWIPLFIVAFPTAAYLWTESLWFRQFVTSTGAPSRYETAFWRIIGFHWSVFGKFALCGGVFLLANVVVARMVCPLPKEFASWVSLHTRFVHRMLAVAAFLLSGIIAFVPMRLWEDFASYGAFERGHGRVPAIVRLELPHGGQPEHAYLPADRNGRFQADLERFAQAVTQSLTPKIEALPDVRVLGAESPAAGHRITREHYVIQGFLGPTALNHQGEPTAYDVYLALRGPTVLEPVEETPDVLDAEAQRQRRTGENYRKMQVFRASVERADLGIAVDGLSEQLLNSKYLRDGFADPIFHKNVGYFLFQYSAVWWTSLWVKVMVWLAFAFIAYQYRFYYHRDAHSMTAAVVGATVHGTVLWIIQMAVGIWRSRVVAEGLLYARPSPIKSGRVPVGVSYVDLKQIEAYPVYTLVVIVLMCVLIVNIFLRQRRIWASVGIAWVGAYLAIIWGYPAIQYVLRVRPNPLRMERVFLQNHISLTRQAFNLESIAQSGVIRKLAQYQDIVAHPEVLKNVQLWDRRVMWERLQQSHTLQRYYEFHRDPDVDRYEVNGEMRQVVVAARELNPTWLAGREWFSKRLKYTHGYGVVVSPVNEVEDPGVPRFWLKGIPPKTPGDTGFESVTIKQPRIYYGELTKDYSIVNTAELEYDYPIEADFATTQYDGIGGVRIGGGLRRLAFASRLNEPLRVALSSALTPESRVLYHRQVEERVQRIAPFLEFDPDPFLVIGKDSGRLWWVIDAYTVSTRYPYSQPFRALDTTGKPVNDLGGDYHTEPDLKRFNYIRNSAVAVIDAYHGSVYIYATDVNDPMIQMYMHLFPQVFTPMDDMPEEVRTHLRFPDYLTWVQSSVYALYHVQDPVIFITGGDAWKLPRELFHSNGLQPMMPYYTVLTLPGMSKPEFVSVLPFAPPATTKRLTAWIVARSDREHYGEVRAYALSRSEEVDGPEQIENRIDQDTELSGQFTLLGAAGSEVIRGNLLLLPVRTVSGEDALFYTEPVYLRATAEAGQSMPELKFVVVIADDKLAVDATFEASLRKVFRVGQFGIASGSIVDAGKSPVQNAVVTLVAADGATLANPGISDATGKFRVENIPPGKYTLRIAREGFRTSDTPVDVQPGIPVELALALQRSEAKPKPVRSLADIAASANQALQQYLKMTGEGKLMDAAKALELLKRELEALNELAVKNRA